MRVLARATALGLLMGLALAANAAADPAPRMSNAQFGSPGGPVFAGDDAIVWGRSTGGAYEIVTMRGMARSVRQIAIPGLAHALKRYVGARVEASSRRVVVGLYGAGCFTSAECDSNGSTRVYEAILTGPIGGELTLVAGCTSAAGCAEEACPVDSSPDVS